MCRDPPQKRDWIKWYNEINKAPHIFLACNSAHNDQIFRKRLGNLAWDTNAHVELRSWLKVLLHSKENFPNKLVQGTSNWAVLLSQQGCITQQGDLHDNMLCLIAYSRQPSIFACVRHMYMLDSKLAPAHFWKWIRHFAQFCN